MNDAPCLPPGFDDLAPFVDRWAVATTVERAQLRTDSTAEQRKAFYDAAAPLLEPALAHLDARPLSDLDPRDKGLLNLMLSLMHVQMAVEIHREMEPQHAAARSVMTITRSVTNLP